MNASNTECLSESQLKFARQLLAEGEPKKALHHGLGLLRGGLNDSEVWKIIGASLGDLGQLASAAEAFTTAIQLSPNDVDCRIALGVVLREDEDIQSSLASLRNAIRVAPGHVEAARELHRSILRLGLLDTEIVKTEAEDCIDFLNFALSRTPGQVDFYYSLSHLYQLFGNDEEAHELMLKIHSFTPDCEVANYNLAVTHKAVGNIETALEHLSAIEHEDDAFMGKVMHSKAHCELMKLDFSKGWSSYEGRWKDINFPSQDLQTKCPKWQGEPGKNVLVWLEQGLGDQVMFSSMLEDAAAVCNELTVVCDPRLVPVFERSFSEKIKVCSSDLQIPERTFDVHLPMGSLGQFFRKDRSAFIKTADGFLKANEAVSNKIRENLRSVAPGEIVGISWFSNSEIHSRLVRNIPLTELVTAIGVEDKTFVCLQYGDVEQDIKDTFSQLGVQVINASDIDQFDDIDNLCNLINACDRVVSVDNVTVHLSAALGVPTTALLPKNADWRWGTHETVSYWYSSLNLVRDFKSAKPLLLKHN